MRVPFPLGIHTHMPCETHDVMHALYKQDLLVDEFNTEVPQIDTEHPR